MVGWPGKGPIIRERFVPNEAGEPPISGKFKGNIATNPCWFDYSLSSLKVILPGRAIMPTYDGYTQAGDMTGLNNSRGGSPRFAGQKPQAGWIEGYVSKNGVNYAGAWVHLYHRENGVLIASMKSNSIGYFKFDFLDPNKNNYYILAVDPDNVYDVVVFDRITP